MNFSFDRPLVCHSSRASCRKTSITFLFAFPVDLRKGIPLIFAAAAMSSSDICCKGETFVTRKITRAVAKIALGLQDKLFLGNLEAKRDWGYAKDYVRMMWMILQADKPQDWVIATGVTTTVRDFVRMAFGEVGIEVAFKGEGVDEKAYVTACHHKDYQIEIGKEVLSIDPKYFRPTEVDLLIGDPTKAKEELGWVPEHDLASLVHDMMEGDIALMKKNVDLLKAGHEILKQEE